MVESGLEMLDDAQLGLGEIGPEPDAGYLANCGGIMWLEEVSSVNYKPQMSPLPPSDAAQVLACAARLHASAWEDSEVLTKACQRLQRHGGSFALAIRNPKELEKMPANWESFKTKFKDVASPGFFDDPSVASLGSRLQKAAPWVASQLAPSPLDSHACLVHGDLKAMNVFLPSSSSYDALLIDFASAGTGYGMADVAMHLTHAVMPGDLEKEEDNLIAGYLSALRERGVGGSYSDKIAMRHYRLGAVDYGRFVLGRFWGAASPESFEAKVTNMNVALVNRDVGSALAFVKKLSNFLAMFEAEMSASP